MNRQRETTTLVSRGLVARTKEADFLLFAMDPCISSVTILTTTMSIPGERIAGTRRAAVRVWYKTLLPAHILEPINDWPGGTIALRSIAVPIDVNSQVGERLMRIANGRSAEQRYPLAALGKLS